jgi:G3E family GTPase
LPRSIVQSIELLPGLAIDGVIVVADAETIEARARDRYMSDTVLGQLAHADIILLNKVDLVSDERAAATSCWLAETVPGARVLPVRNADIPPDVIIGQNPARQVDKSRMSISEHRTGDYETLSVEIDSPRDVERLASGLTDPGLGLLRAKGFIRKFDSTLVTLQVVDRRSLVAPAPSWVEGPGRLVCIGLAAEMDRAAILAAIGV